MLRNKALENIPHTPLFKWDPFTPNDILCKRFSHEDWHYIVTDIDSDEEWCDVLKKNSNFIRCYVLRKTLPSIPIAFVYLMSEDFEGKIYSIHGGGWESPYIYYRGFVFLLEYLLTSGFRIRTTVKKSNKRAFRFVHSVGFVTYRHSSTSYLMYINLKNLRNRPAYRPCGEHRGL